MLTIQSGELLSINKWLNNKTIRHIQTDEKSNKIIISSTNNLKIIFADFYLKYKLLQFNKLYVPLMDRKTILIYIFIWSVRNVVYKIYIIYAFQVSSQNLFNFSNY